VNVEPNFCSEPVCRTRFTTAGKAALLVIYLVPLLRILAQQHHRLTLVESGALPAHAADASGLPRPKRLCDFIAASHTVCGGCDYAQSFRCHLVFCVTLFALGPPAVTLVVERQGLVKN